MFRSSPVHLAYNDSRLPARMIKWGVNNEILDGQKRRDYRRDSASHHLRASASDRDGSKNLHLEWNAIQEVNSGTWLEEP